MFEARDEIADSEELDRQTIIRAIVFGRSPTTFLEKKAAAIIRHPRIDFLLSARILKNLDAITALYEYDEVRLYEHQTKQAIRRYLDDDQTSAPVNLSDGDVLLLPSKSPIIALQPSPTRPSDRAIATERMHEGSLVDFERLAFNGRVHFRFYPSTSFAAYLYQNLLHSLNVGDDVESVRGNRDWRARLLLLLHDTEYNEHVATTAFYANRVHVGDRIYDTSFVPKYDVRALRPVLEPQTRATSEQEMINYYYTADFGGIVAVPDRSISIFLTFPFKLGYYVQPNGRIIYLDIPPPRLKSTRVMMDRICDTSDVEQATEEIARTVSFGEVLGYALYADTLLKQGIALLVLRRMIGDSVRVAGFAIPLPTENDVLAWTRISCRRHSVILPPYYQSRTGDRSLALVQDIANACVSANGAVFMCSDYRLPEIDLQYVNANAKTDAERFVLYTLIMQDYPSPAVHKARKALQPRFGNNINANFTYYTKNARRYTDSTVSDRLESLVEPIARPTDIRSDVQICPPNNCPELYRFTDPQLAELTLSGTVELTREQLAAFIALCVQ